MTPVLEDAKDVADRLLRVEMLRVETANVLKPLRWRPHSTRDDNQWGFRSVKYTDDVIHDIWFYDHENRLHAYGGGSRKHWEITRGLDCCWWEDFEINKTWEQQQNESIEDFLGRAADDLQSHSGPSDD